MPPLPFTAASMTHPLLHLREGPVARLRLNRPELHNAFDATLIAALTGALSGLADDDDVRGVDGEALGAVGGDGVAEIDLFGDVVGG